MDQHSLCLAGLSFFPSFRFAHPHGPLGRAPLGPVLAFQVRELRLGEARGIARGKRNECDFQPHSCHVSPSFTNGGLACPMCQDGDLSPAGAIEDQLENSGTRIRFQDLSWFFSASQTMLRWEWGRSHPGAGGGREGAEERRGRAWEQGANLGHGEAGGRKEEAPWAGVGRSWPSAQS